MRPIPILIALAFFFFKEYEYYTCTLWEILYAFAIASSPIRSISFGGANNCDNIELFVWFCLHYNIEDCLFDYQAAMNNWIDGKEPLSIYSYDHHWAKIYQMTSYRCGSRCSFFLLFFPTLRSGSSSLDWDLNIEKWFTKVNILGSEPGVIKETWKKLDEQYFPVSSCGNIRNMVASVYIPRPTWATGVPSPTAVCGTSSPPPSAPFS